MTDIDAPAALAVPPAPRALAAERPCQLYRHHAPRVVRTQGHHRHPVYLQNRVYGRIQNPELLWVCGSCHDAIHEWLSWLLGEARRPNPEPGRLAKDEAERTFAWWQNALAAAARTLVDGGNTGFR